MSGTRVVAVGGGHGTAVTLRAALRYSSELTGVVSVADDGGSSGRLSELLDVVALGDLRKCLVAVAEPGSALRAAFERRFTEGELAGHPLGNLVLAGLLGSLGDLVAAVDEAGRLLGARARILPATTSRVDLKSVTGTGEVTGQVAVGSSARIERVELVPDGCSAPEAVLDAIRGADQVVVGPGSLFTSVLAAAIVPGITDAMSASGAQIAYVCNLRPQPPETADFTVADHVAALERHGVPVDVVIADDATLMAPGPLASRVLRARLVGRNPLVHDEGLLADALCSALAVSGTRDEEAG